MDRDELIARLRSEANVMEKGLNARLSRDAQFVRCREADTMREAAAALESRPAPTEERALEVLFIEVSAKPDWSLPEPQAVFCKATAVRAMLRFATETQPVAGGELDQVGASVDQVAPWPVATEDDERRARELVDLSFLPMTDEAYEVVARAIAVGRALSTSPPEVVEQGSQN